MKHSSEIAYRADIDGLRALAVLSVIMFHAFQGLLPGGFIGVDIFFVISGYLISSIIFRSFSKNSFSLSDFYSRRIIRIFPALFLVLGSALVFGWFFLFSSEYAQVGKHIAAGAGFVSNLVLWRESGYFDAAAEVKPLLHLWSLGIEEQFYLVWPLLIWLLFKIRNGIFIGIISILLISFGTSVYLTYVNPAAAYYSPISRFWELAAGGVLAFYIGSNGNRIISVNIKYLDIFSFIGIGLITAGLFFINKKSAFPGLWAVLPVLGAALLILAGPGAFINKWCLSNKLAVWFGLISYPLYLWHWPLLVFPRIVGIPTDRMVKAFLITLAILLAWLTYRFFEKPIRDSACRKRYAISLLLAVATSGSLGYFVYSKDGMRNNGLRTSSASVFVEKFENSLPQWKYFEKNDIARKFREECNFYDLERYRLGKSTQVPRAEIDVSCYERDGSLPKAVFIWGDSHAQQLNFGLTRNLPKDWQILQVASSGCPASIHPVGDPTSNYCVKSNTFAIEAISKIKPDAVIIGQNVDHDVVSIININKYLKAQGIKKVIFTGPTPHWKVELPLNVARNLWPNPPERTKNAIDQQLMRDNDLLKHDLEKYSTVEYVDLINVFCNENGCMTRVGNDPVSGITSWDYGHLTPLASDYLAKKTLVKRIIEE